MRSDISVLVLVVALAAVAVAPVCAGPADRQERFGSLYGVDMAKEQDPAAPIVALLPDRAAFCAALSRLMADKDRPEDVRKTLAGQAVQAYVELAKASPVEKPVAEYFAYCLEDLRCEPWSLVIAAAQLAKLQTLPANPTECDAAKVILSMALDLHSQHEFSDTSRYACLKRRALFSCIDYKPALPEKVFIEISKGVWTTYYSATWGQSNDAAQAACVAALAAFES